MQTTQYNRDYLAKWYAEEHLKCDPGITQVIYLPTNAGPREIRFVEVNTLILADQSTDQLVPIDFGVDMGQESEHKLWVIDVTPTQWDRIKSGELRLPDDWTLAGSEVVNP